jgi:hypothetical protein
MELSPIPKLKDQILSAVRDCLFNIRSYGPDLEAVSSIHNLRTRHAVVARNPLNMAVKQLLLRNSNM